MNKNIFCIIPAGGGPKSIPQKNLMDFCGKPLIIWSIDQAKRSCRVNGVYVTSDCEEILQISQKAGAKPIERPAKLATDASSTEDVLVHALDHIERSISKVVDAVVILQPTSPLRLPKDIDAALDLFFAQRADSLFSSAVLENYCIWKCNKGQWERVSFDYKNCGGRQDEDPCCWENGLIYIFRPKVLRQHQNRLGGKITTYPMPFWQFYQIDKPEDVGICEYFMRDRILSSDQVRTIDLRDVRLIVYDFDGVLTNNSVVVREDGLESVSVSRADGLAVNIFREEGIPQIILSTETNRVVETRARKLKIPVIQGVSNKKKILMNYCRTNKIDPSKVVYVGNDINDLEAMSSIGIPVCPADAAQEVKNICRIRLLTPGGSGVVRELLTHFDKLL